MFFFKDNKCSLMAGKKIKMFFVTIVRKKGKKLPSRYVLMLQRAFIALFSCSFAPLKAFVHSLLFQHFDLRISIVTGDALQSLYRGNINI